MFLRIASAKVAILSVVSRAPGFSSARSKATRDSGEGMSPKQVQEEYLRIDRDRRNDRRARTAKPLSRQVRGRKAVGKFAGIIVAEVTEVETKQAGVVS